MTPTLPFPAGSSRMKLHQLPVLLEEGLAAVLDGPSPKLRPPAPTSGFRGAVADTAPADRCVNLRTPAIGFFHAGRAAWRWKVTQLRHRRCNCFALQGASFDHLVGGERAALPAPRCRGFQVDDELAGAHGRTKTKRAPVAAGALSCSGATTATYSDPLPSSQEELPSRRNS
jgi:hypothetical protein